MKSATIPAVRVEPELRDQLESVLAEGESLSAFVEASIRESVQRRRTQAEFLARGMAALARVRDGEPTISAADMIAKLEAKLAAARAVKASKSK